MGIKQFDRASLRMLGEEIEAALAAVAKKYGISIKRGRGTFTAENFTLKLECSLPNASGVVVTKEAADFTRFAASFGLKPDDLNKSFRYCGQRYTVCGIKPRSTRFPILAKRDDGRTFKFNERDVQRWLAGDTATPANASGGDDFETDFDEPAD